MKVLIVTKSDDNECIDFVTRAIEKRGGSSFRFDSDHFPMDVRLVSRHDPQREIHRLVSPRDAVDLDDLTAVWYRRVRFGGCLPQSMDKQYLRASIGEIRKTLVGMLHSLPAFSLDPQPIIRQAENKELQLQVARDAGLETPRTLITNDPEAVRAFAGDCGGRIISKMLSSFAIYDDEGREQVVFTNPVEPTDLDDLDGLCLCPMTFQEMVPKALELRVTIVGEQIFSASIDSQSTERAQYDWRREGNELVGDWKHYDLPNDVSRGLLRLMDRFGLNYGAVDIIVAPDGRHVFLEINPVGEFFWLEHAPGLPISDAIADVLLGRVPRREYTIAPKPVAPG